MKIFWDFDLFRSVKLPGHRDIGTPGLRVKLPGHRDRVWSYRDTGTGHRLIKGDHAPPAEGQGDEANMTVAKFKILKRFKVLENYTIFQKSKFF